MIVPLYAQQVYQGTQSIYFERFGVPGNSPVDIVKSFFTQPSVVWRIATEPARLRLFVRFAGAFWLFCGAGAGNYFFITAGVAGQSAQRLPGRNIMANFTTAHRSFPILQRALPMAWVGCGAGLGGARGRVHQAFNICPRLALGAMVLVALS